MELTAMPDNTAPGMRSPGSSQTRWFDIILFTVIRRSKVQIPSGPSIFSGIFSIV